MRARHEIEAEIDEIISLAESRLKSAKDESIRMLHPAPIDWLESDELNRLHSLQAEMHNYWKQDLNSRNRICIKRALTQARIFIPKEIWYNESELLALAKQHNVEPLKWKDIEDARVEMRKQEIAKRVEIEKTREIDSSSGKVDISLFD